MPAKLLKSLLNGIKILASLIWLTRTTLVFFLLQKRERKSLKNLTHYLFKLDWKLLRCIRLDASQRKYERTFQEYRGCIFTESPEIPLDTLSMKMKSLKLTESWFVMGKDLTMRLKTVSWTDSTTCVMKEWSR